MRKAGAKDYKVYSQQILKICWKNLFNLKFFWWSKIYDWSRKKINTLGNNVFVKVPVENLINKFMDKVIKELIN